MSHSQSNDPGAVEFLAALIAAGAIGMFVFPVVADIIEGVEYSGSSTGVDALWGIMPEVMVIAIVVALVVMVLRMD